MRATIYTLGGFGITRKEITIESMPLIDWAQYKQVPSIIYVEKQKRTRKQMRADSKNPDWIAIEGWMDRWRRTDSWTKCPGHQVSSFAAASVRVSVTSIKISLRRLQRILRENSRSFSTDRWSHETIE